MGSIGAAGGRRPISGMPPMRSNPSTLYPGMNGQSVIGNSLQTPMQGVSLSSAPIHPSSQEMNKPTHLQSQPPPISQVYAPNPTRLPSQVSFKKNFFLVTIIFQQIMNIFYILVIVSYSNLKFKILL